MAQAEDIILQNALGILDRIEQILTEAEIEMPDEDNLLELIYEEMGSQGQKTDGQIAVSVAAKIYQKEE